MKKVGKNTGPFRYYLSQIPYDYTVEVRNRFKGLDLTDRVPEELWMGVHDIVQEVVNTSEKSIILILDLAFAFAYLKYATFHCGCTFICILK